MRLEWRGLAFGGWRDQDGKPLSLVVLDASAPYIEHSIRAALPGREVRMFRLELQDPDAVERAYPEELRAYLNVLATIDGFTLGNVLVWTYRNTLGPSPKNDYSLNWQAIFHLRGRDAPPLDCSLLVEKFAVQDINAPDGRHGDRHYTWQKPDELAERLVRHSTAAGALVVDPFAGSGTFLLAAARLGRRALGCDEGEEALRIAVERGCRRED